jgi:hypothetical protein
MDKRIVILLLFLFTLHQSGAWSFWKSTEQKTNTNDKKSQENNTTINSTPIKNQMDHVNSTMVITFFKDTLFNYYQTRRTFLMVHLIEIVTILSTFTIIQWMLLRFIQGRQRKEKQIDENSLCFNIANNNNNSSESRNGNTYDSTRQLDHILNKPDKLQDITEISAWFYKLELYLETIEREKWYKIAISFIDIRIIKKINLDKLDKSYENLKNQLNKLENNQDNTQPSKTQDKVDCKKMSARIQQDDETIEEFGKSLIKMATKMCPNVAVEALDDLLKTQFVTGLKNKKLSQEVKYKQLKQDCNKKQFNINDAIQHATNKCKAFDLTANYQENESITSRNECNKDTQSDLTTKQSINVIKQKIGNDQTDQNKHQENTNFNRYNNNNDLSYKHYGYSPQNNNYKPYLNNYGRQDTFNQSKQPIQRTQ